MMIIVSSLMSTKSSTACLVNDATCLTPLGAMRARQYFRERIFRLNGLWYKTKNIENYQDTFALIKIPSKLYSMIFTRGVSGVWAGWAIAHPDFGRIEGAAGRRRHATTRHITTCPPSTWQPLTPLFTTNNTNFLSP